MTDQIRLFPKTAMHPTRRISDDDVSSFVCAATLLAPPNAAAQAPAQPARVRVVVDAKDLGEAEGFFSEQVGEQVREAIQGAGYEILDSVDADATVRVRISFFNAADLDYKIDTDVSAGAEIVQLPRLDCPQCVDEDLLERIEGQRGEILAGIEKALLKEDRRNGGDAGDGDAGDGDGDGVRVAPIGPLGGVGIGVLAAGLGLTIGGAVELGRGEVFDDVPDAGFLTGKDHGPRGRVLLGTGLVSVALGGALLVTDLVLRAKKREWHRYGAAVPIIIPRGLGLGWVGQF